LQVYDDECTLGHVYLLVFTRNAIVLQDSRVS
jgi:hypothetical protein